MIPHCYRALDRRVIDPSLNVHLSGNLHIEGDPVVIAPIANHDDNQHGPDENLRIGNLWHGVDLMASLFTMP